MSSDGVTFGIVYPHRASKGGSDAYMLELHGVSTRANLKPGSMIYTSGLGGIFPRGITIGSIVDKIKTSEVWTNTYLIRPAVTPSRVTSVLVLIPDRVTQGIGNVWGAAVNADSATRRVAAAGDSIAKQAAVLEAKARQAVLDSVKKATIDSVTRAFGATAPQLPGAQASQPAPVVRDTTAVRRPAVSPATPLTAGVPRPRRDTTRPDTTRPPRP
jgi:rod shape-determining protein MreC